MKERKVGLSLFPFQGSLGDVTALEIAKEIGVDAVDFGLTNKKRFDVRFIAGATRNWFTILRESDSGPMSWESPSA